MLLVAPTTVRASSNILLPPVNRVYTHYTCLQCFRSLSGPRSDAVGYDDLVQAATGIMVRMVVHVGGVTFSALDEHTCPDHFRAVVH